MQYSGAGVITTGASPGLCVCACVCACVCTCVHACVCECVRVRASVCVCVCLGLKTVGTRRSVYIGVISTGLNAFVKRRVAEAQTKAVIADSNLPCCLDVAHLIQSSINYLACGKSW